VWAAFCGALLKILYSPTDRTSRLHEYPQSLKCKAWAVNCFDDKLRHNSCLPVAPIITDMDLDAIVQEIDVAMRRLEKLLTDHTAPLKRGVPPRKLLDLDHLND
jgi:hypothetical protein